MNARAPTTFLVAAELTTRQDNSGMAGSAPAPARVKSLDASRISGNVSPSVSSAPAPAQAHPRKHPCKQMSLIRPRIPRLHIPMHAACSIVPESLSRPTPMANIFSELSMRVATRVAPLLLIRIVVILFLLHIFAVSIRMSRFAKAKERERENIMCEELQHFHFQFTTVPCARSVRVRAFIWEDAPLVVTSRIV